MTATAVSFWLRITPAGRLLNKDPFIVLPLSPDTDPSALTDWAGDLFQDHADTKDFSADSVVVEAKIKVNDYTKAATAGTNAYGKIGMTSPIIEAEFSIPDGTIHIHYHSYPLSRNQQQNVFQPVFPGESGA